MSIGTHGNEAGLASIAGESSKLRTRADFGASTKASFARVFELMIAVEFFAVCVGTYSASAAYHFISFKALPPVDAYAAESSLVAILFTIASVGFRHGSMLQRQAVHSLLWAGVGSVALAFAGLLTATFLVKISNMYSRGAFVIQVIAVSTAICVIRGIFVVWLRSSIAAGKVETRRAVLIGSPSNWRAVADDWRPLGIKVSAAFSLPQQPGSGSTRTNFGSLSSQPEVRRIVAECRSMLPDDLVIVADANELGWASELASYLSRLPCDIHVSPVGAVRLLSSAQTVEYFRGKTTLCVYRRPMGRADLALKRGFDVIVSLSALIVLSPLLLFTAIAIKLDSPGKVLFRQMRHGYNNQVFKVIKFRTMNAVDDGQSSFASATYNDRRVTALGRVLRQTNIDELPQLFNVLFGQMSIVGPRPHAVMHNQMFEEEILPFARRHSVKPGITGWAQVNGLRGPAMTFETMKRRVEYDLHYIENWSFFLDLKIVLMTVFSKDAYRNAF